MASAKKWAVKKSKVTNTADHYQTTANKIVNPIYPIASPGAVTVLDCVLMVLKGAEATRPTLHNRLIPARGFGSMLLLVQ